MNLAKIGKFISDLRKEKNLTQNQLGEKLGISGKAVSKWERGISAPDISLLQELSEVLGVSVSELLIGERTESDIPKNTANQITISGIQIYKKFMEKKYSKIIIVSIITIILITLIYTTLYLVSNYNKCFVYKLSSATEDFSLEGIVAINQKENSLLITDIVSNSDVKDTVDEDKVEYIKVTVLFDNEIIESSNKQFEGEYLSKALYNIHVSVDEKEELKKFNSSSKMKLLVEYKYFEEETAIEIPIKIEKKFSNNKLIY